MMKYGIREIFPENSDQAFDEFMKIGSTAPGSRIMADKLDILTLKIKGLDPRAANILKQEMLARGGDVATSRDILKLNADRTDVVMFGNKKTLSSLIEKLALQPFGLKELSKELKDFIEKRNRSKKLYRIRFGDHEFSLEKTIIMGVLNVTPDSFSDGGKYLRKPDAIKKAGEILAQGADIIDVGGLSTRPGSRPVDEQEEASRVIPIIDEIVKRFKAPVSIDTYRANIARKAIDAGACMVNDISALRFDKDMASTVSESEVGIVLMHMQGTPENMQKDPQYKDTIDEIFSFLRDQADLAMDSGINQEKIIIDPGIGFGKRLIHNLTVFKRLGEFKSLGFPLLVGASRKSFIDMISDTPADKRLPGSLAAALWSVSNSADILRVHDVEETRKALDVFEAIRYLKE